MAIRDHPGSARRRPLYLGIALVLSTGTPVAAQTATATIRGRVLDAQNAVVPGATVSVLHLDTNASRVVVTTDLGDYLVPGLPPGRYQIAVALDGFRPERREPVVLTVGQDATFDFRLQVGPVAQTITVVTEDQPATTQHTLGAVIGSVQIEDLPTIDRNFDELAKLVPGVTTGVGSYGPSLSLNGQRGFANGVFVDGASNEFNYYGSQASSFAQDWIQEFRVMSSAFPAEYGTAAGGVLNVVTRSGSNVFHGRVYGFFRDGALDAPVFAGRFENGRPQFTGEPPPLSQERFGGFAGGPVARDRVFFFTGVERLDAESSFVLGISDYWRARGVASIVPTGSEDTLFIAKGDAHLSNRHRLSVRYNRSKRLQQGAGAARDTAEHRMDTGGPANDMVGSLTSTIGHAAFNEMRVFRGTMLPPVTCPLSGTGGPAHLELGPPGTFSERLYPGANFGCPFFAGLEGERNLEVSETLSWIAGRHQLKAGAQGRRTTAITDVFNGHDGSWRHSADVAFDIHDPASWPDAFVGNTGRTGFRATYWSVALFLQDTWRVSPSFTLNLGLRYDVDGTSQVGNTLVDERNARIVAQLGGAPRLEPTNVDANNVAPRIGLSWQPLDDRPVTVRVAAGLFYDQVHNNFNAITVGNALLSDGFIRLDANNPGLNPFFDPGDPAGSRQQLRRYLAQGYPFFPDLSLAPRQTRSLDLMDPDLKVPYTAQYTAGLTYDLARPVSVQANYVHARGDHQFAVFDTNADLVDNRIVRPDPRFAAMSTLMNLAWTRHHALQTEVRLRRHTAHLGLAYTLSRTRSNSNTGILGGGALRYARINGVFDLSEEEGPDNADRRHNLVLHGAYPLPFAIQVAGIWAFRSAPPYTVFTTQPLDADPFIDLPEGRNSRRGDSLNTLDLRVTKSFGVGRVRASAFWEGFNALNTDNFRAYQGNLQSATFSLPGGAFEKRRQQIGLRVDF